MGARGPKPKWTPERIAELRQRRAAGETLKQIAVSEGVSKQRIHQLLDGDDPKPRRPTIGDTSGRLTVIGDAPPSANGHRRVLVRCECGNEKVVLSVKIARGETTACGCRQAMSGPRKLVTINGRTQCIRPGAVRLAGPAAPSTCGCVPGGRLRKRC